MSAARAGLTQALGTMRLAIAFLQAALLCGCADDPRAAAFAAEVCRGQKMGKAPSVPAELPYGLATWKPEGDQIAVGFQRKRDRKIFCTITVGGVDQVSSVYVAPGA